MNELYGPDKLLQTYLALRRRVASCRGLDLEHDPLVMGGDADGAERVRVRLADLAWYVRELTPLELRVAEVRLLEGWETEAAYRYLSSLADIEPDEVVTGGTHPADSTLREVRGIRVRALTYSEVAELLHLPVQEVGQAVRSARSKVGRRLWERRQKKEAEHAH